MASTKCDCVHEVSWVITIGDGCVHITPHPNKADYEKEIKPALKLIAKEFKK